MRVISAILLNLLKGSNLMGIIRLEVRNPYQVFGYLNQQNGGKHK